jgi:hypothetical protein
LRSASPPIFPAIPDFDAANSAVVPRQVNSPCRPTIADAIPNLNLGVGAILEMHHDALDLNVAALNKKPDGSESPAGIDTNVVMIAPAIDTRISQAFPSVIISSIIISSIPIVSITPLTSGSETDAQQEHQRTEHTNSFSYSIAFHLFLRVYSLDMQSRLNMIILLSKMNRNPDNA